MRPLWFQVWVWLLATCCLCLGVLIGVASAQHTTAHDVIPDFIQHPTTVTVADGAYCAPATWSTGQVPGAHDVAVIRHRVTYDCPTSTVHTLGLESTGVLQWSRTRSTRLLVGIMLALDGSVLDLGTPMDPLPPGIGTEIIFRDLPLDTSDDGVGVYDPVQYGTGLLCLACTVSMHGSATTAFVRLTQDVTQGATTLHVANTPASWHVGDRLILPDTRQLTAADLKPPLVQGVATAPMRKQSHTEVVTIAARTPTTVVLTAPTQYAHLGVRDQEGAVRFLPHVGHLTRNVVLRSERLDGTRGHTLYTGRAQVHIAYASFLNLGRTTAEPLDNTSLPHIGTNQIGRYPLHVHHMPGRCGLPTNQPQFTIQGVVIEDGRKWGLTLHNSHYGLVADTIVFNTTGAGIVTEDGSEWQNTIRGNWIIDSESGVKLTGQGELHVDPAGRKGNGFWFRGPGNHIVDNLATGTREGFGWYTGALEAGPSAPTISVKIPTHPCADTDVVGEFTRIPLLWQMKNGTIINNESYSSSEWGFGLWVWQGQVPLDGLAAWHSTKAALRLQYFNGDLRNVTLRNQGGLGHGILQFNHFTVVPMPPSSLTDFTVDGFVVGYAKDGQLTLAPQWTFRNGFVRAKQGFLLPHTGQGASPSHWVFDSMTFAPLAENPLSAIVTSYPTTGDLNNVTKRVDVTAYQGRQGDDFRVYWTAQAPDAPAYTGPGSGPKCPTSGLTNAQCWAAHQVATLGSVASCADTREGVTGFACATGCVPQCPVDMPCGTTAPDGCGGSCTGPVCPPTMCSIPLAVLHEALKTCQ